MSSVSKVIIVGGTHGNEFTGVQIVKHYQDYLTQKFPELKLEFILANPEAHKLNTRFKDEDLNRAFQYLNEDRTSYEHKRAHEIKKIIQKEKCLVLDLHTTTSNMGSTVIVSHYNSLNLSLCSALSREIKNCRIIGAPDPQSKYLASQSEFGLIIEVGPVANGVVSAAPLENSLVIIECILKEVMHEKLALHGSLEIYEEVQDVAYPTDEKDQITGYIHCSFQDQDFVELEGTFTPFRSFKNQNMEMNVEVKLYPIFINEAAYYPQQLAFTLCRKNMILF
jgi:succinylglutamate desuccinylase